MSLSEAESRLLGNKQCRISDFLAGLDKADSATFDRWVSERRTASWITRIANADGLRLNEKTVKKHLEGLCMCPPSARHRGVYGGS